MSHEKGAFECWGEHREVAVWGQERNIPVGFKEKKRFLLLPLISLVLSSGTEGAKRIGRRWKKNS